MKFLVGPLALFGVPLIASAQFSTTGMLIAAASGLVSLLIKLAAGVALLVFFWGIIQYLFTDAKEKGSKLMIWGVIALFVMVSIWGIVSFIRTELGISPVSTFTIPSLTPEDPSLTP